MATIRLPPDFREFLELLNSARVRYLLVGGHAVGYYGYPRSTGDMDIWLAAEAENAAALVNVLREFGFSADCVSPEPFLAEHKVIRIGVPPLRIDLLTSLSGVDFAACYARRTVDTLDGVEVSLIGLDDLKANKVVAGRARDLDDLEHLP